MKRSIAVPEMSWRRALLPMLGAAALLCAGTPALAAAPAAPAAVAAVPTAASPAAPPAVSARPPAVLAPEASGALKDPQAVLFDPFLSELEERTFRYFWETANPKNGLIPDRYPTPSFASIAAVGFGLTAYPIGVERQYISRAEARDRVLATLRFFVRAPNEHGFYYHFLDMNTGARTKKRSVASTRSRASARLMY